MKDKIIEMVIRHIYIILAIAALVSFGIFTGEYMLAAIQIGVAVVFYIAMRLADIAVDDEQE